MVYWTNVGDGVAPDAAFDTIADGTIIIEVTGPTFSIDAGDEMIRFPTRKSWQPDPRALAFASAVIVALATGACEDGSTSPTMTVQPSQSLAPESVAPSAVSPTEGQLGPLAEQPTIPDGSTGLGLSVPFEILLEPREQQWVDFPAEPLAEGASCADGSISFTWSAASPIRPTPPSSSSLMRGCSPTPRHSERRKRVREFLHACLYS